MWRDLWTHYHVASSASSIRTSSKWIIEYTWIFHVRLLCFSYSNNCTYTIVRVRRTCGPIRLNETVSLTHLPYTIGYCSVSNFLPWSNFKWRGAWQWIFGESRLRLKTHAIPSASAVDRWLRVFCANAWYARKKIRRISRTNDASHKTAWINCSIVRWKRNGGASFAYASKNLCSVCATIFVPKLVKYDTSSMEIPWQKVRLKCDGIRFR